MKKNQPPTGKVPSFESLKQAIEAATNHPIKTQLFRIDIKTYQAWKSQPPSPLSFEGIVSGLELAAKRGHK